MFLLTQSCSPAGGMMSWGADFACSTELLKLDEVVALSPKKNVNALAGAQCAEQQ